MDEVTDPNLILLSENSPDFSEFINWPSPDNNEIGISPNPGSSGGSGPSNPAHVYDSDRLGDFLEQSLQKGDNTLSKAGIKLSLPNPKYGFHTEHNPEYSRIARYVRSLDRDIFGESPSIHNTRINGDIISNIRQLKVDTPITFK